MRTRSQHRPALGAGAAVLSLGLLAACSNGAVDPTTSGASGAASQGTAPAASPSPTPTPTGPSTLPAQGALVLEPVTHVQNDKLSTAFVKPSCAQPAITMGPTAWSPAGDATAKVAWPADRTLESGTNHAPVADAYAHPASQVHGWITHTKPQPKKKIAFLTFDDGPNGVTTPQVLKILRDAKVPATFFEVTRQVNDTTAPIVRQQIAEGHAIAIHSYGHDYQYLYPYGSMSATNISCDIDWAVASLRAQLGDGYTTTAYRYPGGHMSWKRPQATDAMLAKRHMSYIDWNSMDGDADTSVPHDTVADMVANVSRTQASYDAAKDNALVLLMHDYEPNPLTVQALPTIIKNLKKQGWSFGVIS